jgi:hypothetical protein
MFEDKEFNGYNEKVVENAVSTTFGANHIA